MSTKNTLRLIATFACILTSTTSMAEAGKPSFDFDAKIGYLSDSNVGLSDIDANTGEADSAQTYALAFKAALPVTSNLTGRIFYDYTDTAYQELSQFDLGLHHLGTEVALKSRIADTAITVDKFTANLGGDDYLDLLQFSPSISRLVDNKVYIRAAYTQGRKTYATLPGRDSVNSAYRGDMYMLIDQMDRYVSLGIQSGDEDAVDDANDYKSLRWNTSYGHLLDIGTRGIKVKAQLSYEHRKYAFEDESIGDTRQDRRVRLRLGADWTVFEHLALMTYVEHSNIHSNLESAILNKTVYGIGLASAF